MADPGTLSLIGLGIGSLIDGAGKIIGNHAAAEAEKKNQEFYDQQAAFAAEAGRRNEEVFLQSTSDFLGNQTSAFAKAGVDISGSALMVLQDTKRKAHDEVAAIHNETEMNVLTAKLRGEAAGQNAANYSSFWNNALPVAGSLLKAGGEIYIGGAKLGKWGGKS